MIARFRIRLPYVFSIPEGLSLATFAREYGGYQIRVYPPVQLDEEAAKVGGPTSLQPADPVVPDNAAQVDGVPTIPASLMQIDFIKDEFDRRVDNPQSDPPNDVLLGATNDLLARLRSVGRIPWVKPFQSFPAAATLEYLTDDGASLQQQEGLLRRRWMFSFGGQHSALVDGIWVGAGDLPDNWASPVWDRLLLDAEAALPDVGAALVLTYTAIEVFIGITLNDLAAQSAIPTELWKWINKRGDYLKEPSTEEQLDALLRILTGSSLKTAPDDLWQAYVRLRKARNTFAHQGEAAIDGAIVDPAVATQLVAAANKIVNWIEELLPAETRRKRWTGTVTWTFQKLLFPPAPTPAATPLSAETPDPREGVPMADDSDASDSSH